ncbi:isochorismatase family protein [Chitinimonas sp. BJB300]|uniref:isochorismatase family protein n=1 Tax=Chitinimonas sp. BJB300 TaxID=1559339 RepID=UPI000C0CC72C|nr:isochorismatase family protein [Chitinimonas sp. BJB300]PHV13304.1 hydrolase [Chitinimonas sp. BJB300]TSJ85991.1 isochorismatase family protein [Chitinimonas sp. BJB300]
MSRALFVIDVQASFRHTPCWQTGDFSSYLAAQNKLIISARAAGVPIIRVFHVNINGCNTASKTFRHNACYIVALAGSDPIADHTAYKQTHSALVDTGLSTWLHALNIDSLIISGIRTEQDRETKAHHGTDIGFSIDFVTEATLTFPIKHNNDRLFSAAEIKERTELVLAGRFARFATIDEVVAELPVLA